MSADVKELQSECRKVTESAKSVRAFKGNEGWLYSFKELRHMSQKKLWTDQAVAEIKAYSQALQKEGIKLIVVPVPPKVSIYPEHLSKELKAVNPYRIFHRNLADSGVKSVDLFEAFINFKKSEKAFCKQDSHFSPEMAVKIASQLCIPLNNSKKIGNIPVKKEVMAINGDLRRQLEEKPAAEKLSFSFVEPKNPAVPNSDSSVLLLGDSNFLIYHKGGDMLARSAGIADHLSSMLAKSVDLLAVKGSGVNIARIDLYRRFLNPVYLKKKKTVVWCFSAHELTETENWKRIPVKR
jgi:hypothetical protein